jgi:hypothetical protein
MPSYVVKIKADLENVTQLIPLPDNHWKFNIQSTDGKLYNFIFFSYKKYKS